MDCSLATLGLRHRALIAEANTLLVKDGSPDHQPYRAEVEAEHQVTAVTLAHDTSPNVSPYPNDFELMRWAADGQCDCPLKLWLADVSPGQPTL